ncbi:Hypp7701 [Branchiostoma lanceolatum]|nr:Hypp7701 [Branchiostoma lanceolatum]
MRDLMETNVKTLSIRKIADHFMCKNVPQLGTIPYQPRTSVNKYQPACYHETDATGTHFRLRYGRKSNVRPSLPSQQTQEESPPEAEEADPDSSSYPVGTSVSRGVTSASRGVSPAARGRGRARPLGTRARDAGWVYNPLHKQVPVEFGNHDDGWLSDGDSAAYSPDDVLHVYVQQPKVTTTLVPREGRSTIFDIDDVTASQGDHEKGHMKRQNTGMSFSKIKKELEKSTTVVRGKGARRRHVFQERSKEDADKKSEARREESQGGRACSLRGKTSEKFKKSNDTWRMPAQTCASRHETKRSSEDRGKRSSTRPPVSTYAQVLTGEKTQRDGDANEVTSTPKENEEKEARMKSEQEKQKKADRQCRSQNKTRDCSEKQAAGSKTSEDDTKEEDSGWTKKKGRHWSGRKVQCKKTWGKIGHMAVANNSKESGLGNEAGFHQSSPKKLEPQTLNRRGQEQWPTLFKQKPEIEHQRHHSERSDFSKSPQQPRGEMNASFAKGPSSRDGEKCRSELQGKLPKSNYDKQDTNQRLRSVKNFSKKQNCSCGLPHEGDIPKAITAKTSRVVGSGRISEPRPHPPRRNREQRPPPSSAKYGILSTQDGRKKREGPKDGRKRRDGPMKDPKEENLDVSIEELLPFKNSAYKYLFTPGADMDASTAENYDKLIFHYNQEYFRHKQGD